MRRERRRQGRGRGQNNEAEAEAEAKAKSSRPRPQCGYFWISKRFHFTFHTAVWPRNGVLIAHFRGQVYKTEARPRPNARGQDRGRDQNFGLEALTSLAKIKRRWYYTATHRHYVNVVQSNITFFIFAVFVVWYTYSRPYTSL